MSEDRAELQIWPIVIIGGGFAGSLAALKLAAQGLRPVLVERAQKAGAGLAYGAAHDHHVLNVPAGRMEVGLSPGFADWLRAFPHETAVAVKAAGGIANAFVTRVLYGNYLQSQMDAAVQAKDIRRLCGEVVDVRKHDGTYVLKLADGRKMGAAQVVLATGNEAPKAPFILDDHQNELADSPEFVSSPWRPDAFAGLPQDAPVLLIGAGLTMADMALSLAEHGHTGPIFALSRRGLMPLPHVAGGSWPAFLHECTGQSPLRVLCRLRAEAKAAIADGVPWQCVLDAARPHVAKIWAAWSRGERRQFLRLARPYWDVHRHRMAPHAHQALQNLLAQGRLVPLKGHLKHFTTSGKAISLAYVPRGQSNAEVITVARVINCTGPRSDFEDLGTPLFSALREQDLIQPDGLGLGISTQDTQVVDANGQVSDRLFALGALTRPAWWEITAVPEIAAQVNRLVEILISPASHVRDTLPKVPEFAEVEQPLEKHHSDCA